MLKLQKCMHALCSVVQGSKGCRQAALVTRATRSILGSKAAFSRRLAGALQCRRWLCPCCCPQL